MKSARELQQDVIEELRWEPSLDAAEIGVSTDDGEITLTGQVRSYTQRGTAEEAVRRVIGVRAVINDLFVKLPLSMQPADAALAQAVARALEDDPSVPEEVRVSVAEGWITLEGAVERVVQKESAYRAVRDLRGVRGVTSLITVRPHAPPGAIRQKERPVRRHRLLPPGKRARLRLEAAG